MTTNPIKFAKGNPTVIIPTKREEDMGYDIYANFEEDYILIPPHKVVGIPTNLHSAFSKDYGIILKERGSTGTKGMSVRCGVIDSGFRGAWFIPINNTTDTPIIIAKSHAVEGIKTEDRKFEGVIPCKYLVDGKGNDICRLSISNEDYIIYPYEKAICQAVVHIVPPTKSEEITLDELMQIESERGVGQKGSSNK